MPKSTRRTDPHRVISIAALGVAVVFAAIVTGIYVLNSGDQSASPAAADNSPPFGSTPLADLPGMPTPVPNTGPLEPHRPEIGSPAPDFALVDVRDPSLIRKLSDYAGTPVVLNWYASWCIPCREELPGFQRAQDALGDSVVFLAVNFIESQSNALSILEDTGVTFPAVLDSSGAVSDHYRVSRRIPTSFFIDAEGIVRSIHLGELSPAELAAELARLGLDYAPGE